MRADKLALFVRKAFAFLAALFTRAMLSLPFVQRKRTEWAIGIYRGDSPLTLAPTKRNKPVLTAQDVTDVQATLVADPFMVQENGTWYMFFEVFNAATDQGEIALATSQNGSSWTYQRVVLDEPYHLSYPYVFEWQGEWYMLPETYQKNEARLYRADDFPYRWSYVGTLIEGQYVDSSLLHYEDRWWLFTAPYKDNDHRLRLFFADDLLGPWTEHPSSPIVDWDPHIARPGGRMVAYEDRIIRYAQDSYPRYGIQVYAFEISELTPTTYREKRIGNAPVLAPTGRGWNARNMHQIDPHPTGDGRWIACVDGVGHKLVLAR